MSQKTIYISLIIIGTLVVFTGYRTIEVSPTVSIEDIIITVKAQNELTPRPTTPAVPDGPDSNWYYSTPLEITEPTVITGIDIDMNDASLHSLHHTSIGLINRPATLCADHFAESGGMFEIYSASRLTAAEPVRFPEQHGVVLQPGDQVVVEFMEHTQGADHGPMDHSHTFTPELQITLQTTSDIESYTDLQPVRLRLDDTPCVDPLPHQAFVVSTSTEPFTKTVVGSEESASYTFDSDGTIVFGGANFWPRKGGENVVVKINDEPVQIFTALSGEESWDWTIPHSYEEIEVDSDDIVSIESTYTNPFDTPVKDASGMYGFFFAGE